ncbi:MAG: hypothetical protein ACT4P7_18055 [Gemmatimonadaceae bacterium]
MDPTPAEDPSRSRDWRWWAGWGLVAVLVGGGVYLTLTVGPRMTPVLDALR